jgi:hypothetical protein
VINKNAGLNKKHIPTNKHAVPFEMSWPWQLQHDVLADARLQCNKPAMLMNWIQDAPCRQIPQSKVLEQFVQTWPLLQQAVELPVL